MSQPYTINMDVKFQPLELIDVQTMIQECPSDWYYQTLVQVNNSVVRLGILHGEFHWHKHDKEDEFFFVLDGKLFIDFQKDERTVELTRCQGLVVPRGAVHRTRAPEKTVVLMVEPSGVVPTGD